MSSRAKDRTLPAYAELCITTKSAAGLPTGVIRRRFDRRQITSGLPPEADIFGVGRHVPKVPICCKSRKLNDPENLAKVGFRTSPLPHRLSTPLRRSVIDS